MVKNEHIIKDNILSYLKPNSVGLKPNFSTMDIQKKIKIDDYIINYLFETMQADKNIKLHSTTNKAGDGYIATITNRGLAFKKFGGYSKESQKLRLEKIWKITKIVANVLNAVAIIGIGIVSIFY